MESATKRPVIRSKKPMTAAQRKAKQAAKMRMLGYVAVNAWIRPEAAAALAKLREIMTIAEAIEEALIALEGK